MSNPNTRNMADVLVLLFMSLIGILVSGYVFFYLGENGLGGWLPTWTDKALPLLLDPEVETGEKIIWLVPCLFYFALVSLAFITLSLPPIFGLHEETNLPPVWDRVVCGTLVSGPWLLTLFCLLALGRPLILTYWAYPELLWQSLGIYTLIAGFLLSCSMASLGDPP